VRAAVEARFTIGEPDLAAVDLDEATSRSG
jgi:hypothetical protein